MARYAEHQIIDAHKRAYDDAYARLRQEFFGKICITRRHYYNTPCLGYGSEQQIGHPIGKRSANLSAMLVVRHHACATTYLCQSDNALEVLGIQ